MVCGLFGVGLGCVGVCLGFEGACSGFVWGWSRQELINMYGHGINEKARQRFAREGPWGCASEWHSECDYKGDRMFPGLDEKT